MNPMYHGARYMDPEYWWYLNGSGRNEYPHHHLHPHPHSHPPAIHEAILREIEKERIREDIIMSEIVRRRVLEAEVRRELMMEREMALRQDCYGFPLGSSPLMWSESPMRPSLLKAGWSAEERLGMALEDNEKLKRSGNGGLETLPFQRGTAELRISEVKSASEGNKEKERIILLTKPDENVYRSKTKDVPPPEVVNIELLADLIANKKSKEEWGCALCQVMATSEKDLNEHVIGKKHKSKEAALTAQWTGQKYSIGLFPKKATKSVLVEEERVKLKAKSLLSEKAGEATSKKDDLLFSENPKSEHLKKTHSEVIGKVQKNEDDPRKKVQKNEYDPRKQGCEFQCELCQVGKSDQALDKVSSEDNILLDVVEHEERDVKTLDSKVVNIELPADVIASKKSKDALSQVQEEREGKTSDSKVPNIDFPEAVQIELPADVIAHNRSKERWSCALCHVVTTSEKDLNEHVLGKKHESKVATLRTQTTVKTYSIKHFAKKPANSIYVEKEGVKLKALSLFSEKVEDAASKKDDLPLLGNPKSEHLKGTQADVSRQVQKSEDDLRKKVQRNENDPTKKGCEFWCEMCQVGTLSSEVMNAHKLGKKHVSRLRKCEQDGGIGSFNQKKSDVLVDTMEDVSGNEKIIHLGKFNQALDHISSEDRILLDAVDHKERQGKILDSEVVNIELHADVIASKKPEEWSIALCQVDEEREGKTLDSEVVNIEHPEIVNNELHAYAIANKKSKEGWNCALCQVITTSKKDLNEHVLGKKHESKMAALRAQTTGKNYSTKLFAKKPAKSIYVEKEGLKLKAQSLFSEKAGEATSKKDDLPFLENPNSEHLKETRAEVNRQVQKNEDPMKKGCVFWCEMCQVGTLSSEVMTAHKLGKKHVSRLRKCEQDGGTGSFNQKKSDVHVSGNGENIDLGVFNQALDEVSSENHMVLDTVDHKERQGKTLDSKVVKIELPEVVDIELHADVIATKKSEEWSSALFQEHKERQGKTLDSEMVTIELPEVVNNELPSDVTAENKSKEEWSCALCQVSVTSEKGLNEHVLGKKHKSKEAAFKSSEGCTII